MHVETPPLKQQTASGKPRSLFMDIKHSVDLEDGSSRSSVESVKSTRATPRVFSYRKGQQSEKREWWDRPTATVRRDPVRDVSFFEFNVPEHYPSSPMCPASPKHTGKLKVCVVSLYLGMIGKVSELINLTTSVFLAPREKERAITEWGGQVCGDC